MNLLAGITKKWSDVATMPAPSLSRDAQLYTARFITLALASLAGALFGFVLLPAGSTAALVWPSSAIGVAALFLYGYDLWPAILLTITAALFVRGGNLPLSIAVALGNTLEALLGAYILKRYIDFNPLINSLQNGFGIIAASIVPTLISGGVVTVASYYFGRTGPGDVQAMWTTLWIGHAVTCLSFTPFFIRWLYRPFFTKTWRELAEGAVIFGGIGVISYALFWTSFSALGSVSLVYILILPLLWASIRTGPRGTTLALAPPFACQHHRGGVRPRRALGRAQPADHLSSPGAAWRARHYFYPYRGNHRGAQRYHQFACRKRSGALACGGKR